MTLTLRALSLNDRPLTQPITAHFDDKGGSIGRSDNNTLALPDPERHISRQHAEIKKTGDGFQIKNVGSANPITVRDESLARGESTSIGHQDQVRIGGYLLEVIEEDDRAGTVVEGRAALVASPAMPRPSSATPAPPRMTSGRSPAGLDLAAPLSPSNPFADLLGDVAPSPAQRSSKSPAPTRAADPFMDAPPAGVPSSSGAWGAPPKPPGPALLPDDFDPFATAPRPPAPVETPRAEPGAFGDLVPGTTSSSIDQLFGLTSGDRDPLAGFMANVTPAASPDPGAQPIESVSVDPMALFGAAPGVDTEKGSSLDDHVPELRGAFTPPSVRPPRLPEPPAPAQPAVTARAPSASVSSADPDVLWSAFCQGAGISVKLPQGLGPEMMQVIGELLRASIAGTLQLMAVRATAKHELRAQVTVIRARNNNPLKFSPDARSALEQMLQPPMRGFLPGAEAMTDAMNDLVGHAIGTLAGTRAALEGVLHRFTPQQLESKLVGQTMLDRALPINRKAKLWELYLQHFDAIRDEAHDDFHSLFGRAFLAAYEQQLERLRREQVPG